MTHRSLWFNKSHHIWFCLLTFNIIKLLLRYLFRSLPWKLGKAAETHREEYIPPWEHFYNRLVPFIHMSHLLKSGMCGMGHWWAAYNDLLSLRGGPDLWWTPGGPVTAAEATGRHSTFKHSPTICTQIRSQERAAQALFSIGSVRETLWIEVWWLLWAYDYRRTHLTGLRMNEKFMKWIEILRIRVLTLNQIK